MGSIVQTFFDIALWRRGPQDLPYSRSLVWVLGLIYAAAYTLQICVLGWDVRSALLLAAIDLAMLYAWVWGLLSFFGKRARFIQTITAVLGAGTLISLFYLLVSVTELALTGRMHSPEEWGLLRLIIALLVLGRILQQALDRGLMVGVMLTYAMLLSVDAVVQGLIPGM